MRLLLDLQGLFAPTTASRGIGFYARQLAEALCRDARAHEVHLLLSHTGDPAAVVAVREAFSALVRHEHVHLLEPLAVASFAAADRDSVASVDEALREALIASLSPDVVLVTSLFELGAAFPTSVNRWVPGVPTAVVLYDLMPLEEPELLADPQVRAPYERKLADLARADVLLTISEHSRERALALLPGCPPATPIYGAPIPMPRFGSGQPPAELRDRSFVLCVGGDHPRKNMDGLVRAWGQVSPALREGRALVLACEISAKTRRMLNELAAEAGLRADEVVITGFVSPDDLAWLYDRADLFVFPSFSEGLGLPALEAMERGCPVVAADATSLRELVTVNAARFDPADPGAMARTIELALGDESLMQELRAQSEQQAATFTWPRTAALAWDALEQLHAASQQQQGPPVPPRPRVAVVSPWPPVRSGVADYALTTSVALAAQCDVTLVGDAPAEPGLTRISREEFAASWWAYDRVLYHFGNSPYHTDDMATLPQAPGVVLLHDSTLAGTLRFADEPLGHSGGVEALLQESGPRVHAGDVTDQRGLRAVLSGALGVQVQSEHAASEVARAGYAHAPVAVVPHPVLEVGGGTRRERPPDSPLLVGHFGFVHAFKQPELLLEAAGLAARRVRRPIEVVFVGAVADETYQAALQRVANRAQVQVRFLGYASAEDLGAWMQAVDCAVQLRSVSHGESSGSVARLLAAGRPTVVSDIGSFSDLPRDVVRHHRPGGTNEELADALVECLTPETGEVLGKRAASYASDELSLSAWAAATQATLDHAYAGSVAVQGAPALRRAAHAASPQVRDALARVVAAGAARRSGVPRVWGSDISVLSVTPFLTGIQRVTLSLHRELPQVLPHRRAGVVAVDVVPAAVSVEPHASIRADAVLAGVEVRLDDCEWLLCLDLDFGLPQVERELLEARARGTRVLVNVYDVLILTNPEWFVPGATAVFRPWLETVVRVADVVTVNSVATREALQNWVREHLPDRSSRLRVEVLPLGVDVPERLPAPRPRRDRAPHFVVLGTIEPRKGHDDVLDAFDLLWNTGEDVELTVVGRQGWMVEALVKRLSGHHEDGRRLRWLPAADDAALAEVLDVADGVIVPSRGEGYGLPVVEAAARDLPLIVRDVPVLREVAGDGATWFAGGGADLASVLKGWVVQWQAGKEVRPTSVRTHSWNDVARRLVDLLDQPPTAAD